MDKVKKVFVNGTFDVLHIGHLRLFNYAKEHGDYLLVAIDSDRRIEEKKGPGRPINHYNDRREFLLNLESVDEVQEFDSDQDLTDIVKDYQPDVMIVGAEYKDGTVIGSEHAKELKFFERIYGYSTTRIVDRR